MINPGTLRAKTLIKELGINDASILEHLEDICMHRGLYVKKEEISGAEGRLVLSGGKGDIKGVATVNTSEVYECRTRFSIAHEFGHFELHKNQDFSCSIYSMNEWFAKEQQRKLEVEANSFASEFLMPEDIVKNVISKKNPTIDVIKALSDEFKTSLAASAIKLVEHSPEPCAVVFYDSNGVKFHFRSKMFEEQKYWVAQGPLSSDTYAFDLAKGKSVPSAMSDVAFDAWVDTSGKPDWVRQKLSDKTIKEQSIWFSKLQQGLSLLWIRDASLIWS